MTHYDIIAVGGGIGGASLATVMAERGSKVLVVERTIQYSDRVRGEVIHPWGVAEVRELGLLPTYLEAGAHELPYWRNHPPRISLLSLLAKIGHDGVRHLPSTTPSKLPHIAFYHPTVQEALLQRAETAGADVWRGATVKEVRRGSPPAVTVRRRGRNLDLTARLVVGTDGRNSQVRGWGGFQVKSDDDGAITAGMLFDDLELDDAATHTYQNSSTPGSIALLFPQGKRRVRAYFVYPATWDYRLSGSRDIESFFERCIAVGVPETLQRRRRMLASWIGSSPASARATTLPPS